MTCHNDQIVLYDSCYSNKTVFFSEISTFLFNLLESISIECVPHSCYIIMIYVVYITCYKICILAQIHCIVMMCLLPHTEKGIGLWDTSLAIIYQRFIIQAGVTRNGQKVKIEWLEDIQMRDGSRSVKIFFFFIQIHSS